MNKCHLTDFDMISWVFLKQLISWEFLLRTEPKPVSSRWERSEVKLVGAGQKYYGNSDYHSLHLGFSAHQSCAFQNATWR